jgi:hypothetical protein
MNTQSSETLQTNASVLIPKFGASINFIANKNLKAVGFLPDITQSIAPDGKITTTTEISLPIQVCIPQLGSLSSAMTF